MIEKKMEEVIKILRERGWTIATMESCTGGAMASCITNIPGSSDVFEIGKVTYSIKAKIEAGVDEEIIKKYGVFSKETAWEMARKIGGDIGVGVTGNLNFPGDVFVAVRIKDQIKSIKLKAVPDDRQVKGKSKNKIEGHLSELRQAETRKEMKEQVVERIVEMILDKI